MDTFPTKFKNPNKGAKVSQKENIYKANFGDGYTQRVLFGVNARHKALTLSWTLKQAECRELYSWLAERKNLTPFNFTYFEDVERQYLCTDCSLTDNSPAPCTVSATFEENFDIGAE